MDERQAQIASIAARLARLEQRFADESAALHAELDALGAEARPAPVVAPTAAPARIPFPRSEVIRPAIGLGWLTGPRGLAVAGGVVTLLGIVFVFALAASRGWIGPAVRCSIGGGVSVALLAAALVARRRYGQLVAGLAAAGVGVGGAYVTLYAASRGYHLLGAAAVWFAVVAVAAVAVALALAWSSELLAVLGLVAVVVAPPIVEGRLNGIGLGASAVAATAAVGIGQGRGWRLLGGLAYGLLLVQGGIYAVDARHGFAGAWPHRGTAGLIACVVLGLGLAAAASYGRREESLEAFAAALAGITLPFALLATWTLVHDDGGRGSTLLGLAAVYALASAGLRLRGWAPDLADLFAAFALFAVAFGTATYLSGGGLLVAWTLEGLALTGLARRLPRSRYQAAGLAYLGAAILHLLAFETPISHLFGERTSPARHVGELVLVAAALAVAAWLARGPRAPLVPRLGLLLLGIAGLLALYAGSLGLLEAAQQLGGGTVHARFQRGETLVSALWALTALTLLAVGLLRNLELRYAGLALLGLALAKLFLFDLSQLSSLTRAASFLAVGLALLAGGFLVQRLARTALPPGGAAHGHR